MATKSKKPAAGPADKALRVTALRPSFWRGGLQFSSATPRVVSLADLTPEQAEAIREERMLVVEEVDIEAAKP
jgi:hypothetical protein